MSSNFPSGSTAAVNSSLPRSFIARRKASESNPLLLCFPGENMRERLTQLHGVEMEWEWRGIIEWELRVTAKSSPCFESHQPNPPLSGTTWPCRPSGRRRTRSVWDRPAGGLLPPRWLEGKRTETYLNGLVAEIVSIGGPNQNVFVSVCVCSGYCSWIGQFLLFICQLTQPYSNLEKSTTNSEVVECFSV